MKQKLYLFHSIFTTNYKNNISAGDIYVLLSFSKYLFGNSDRSSSYIYLENREISFQYLSNDYRYRRSMQKNLLYFVERDKLKKDDNSHNRFLNILRVSLT